MAYAALVEAQQLRLWEAALSDSVEDTAHVATLACIVATGAWAFAIPHLLFVAAGFAWRQETRDLRS